MEQVIKKRKGAPTSEERDIIVQALGSKVQPLREILSQIRALRGHKEIAENDDLRKEIKDYEKKIKNELFDKCS